MKITAFAGSNSSKSTNLELVKYAVSKFDNAKINLLNLNDFEMPIYSIDREAKGIPEQAYTFLNYMKDCDAIVCSFSENNRTFSAAFKNIFDWCSRIEQKVFAGHPMLLMSTSIGSYGGAAVMAVAQKILPEYGADIIETFSLPSFNENFVDGKGIVNEDLNNSLSFTIKKFKSKL